MRGGGCLLPIALLSSSLIHAVRFPCLLPWGDLCWGKYSPALLTPCSSREPFLFKKLKKHESVKLLHNLNLSCSSLRNIHSWSLFFFQLSSLSVFYITFLTPCKILLLSLELNLAKTYNLLFLLSRARFLHMANFPVFCLAFCVVPRCMGSYCFTSETLLWAKLAYLLSKNALWYSV